MPATKEAGGKIGLGLAPFLIPMRLLQQSTKSRTPPFGPVSGRIDNKTKHIKNQGELLWSQQNQLDLGHNDNKAKQQQKATRIVVEPSDSNRIGAARALLSHRLSWLVLDQLMGYN